MNTATIEAHGSEYCDGGDFRSHFPALCREEQIIYFDSAATAQRPAKVIAEEYAFAVGGTANPGRAAHSWAQEVEHRLADERRLISSFFGANSAEELIFTSGATHSLNLVAWCYGANTLRDGDEVMFCISDHQSMVAPWFNLQSALQERGISIHLVPYRLRANGEVDPEDITAKLSPRTKILNLTHVNNAVGTINNVAAIRERIGSHVVLNLDIAQSFAHIPLRITELGADFASFSGHKCFSAGGIGGLWISPRVRGDFKALFAGGGPGELEPGTQNISGIVSLGAAIRFIKSLGEERYFTALEGLTERLYEKLLSSMDLELRYAMPMHQLERKSAIASFTIPGVSSADAAEFFSEQGILLRSGNFCTGTAKHPLDALRVSLQCYNNEDELDELLKLIRFVRTHC